MEIRRSDARSTSGAGGEGMVSWAARDGLLRGGY
jgi:hypothetical protein